MTRNKFFIVAITIFCIKLIADNRYNRSNDGDCESETYEIRCSVMFTPGQNCTQRIINRINAAKKSILIQSYSFTSQKIADALINAAKRGVTVILIVDKSQQKNTLILKMAQHFPVFIDRVAGIAHNKVIIIDSKIVLTGSFNFTQAAQYRNVENSVELISLEIAKKYTEQWIKRRKFAKRIKFMG